MFTAFRRTIWETWAGSRYRMRMRLPTGVMAASWLAAVTLACGGKAVIDEGVGEDGGGGATDPTSGVACGPAGSCTFECCLDPVGDAAPFCATNCSPNLTALSCDGPEDCGGDVCCMSALRDAACKPQCDLPEQERCHTSADCTAGTCIPSGVANVDTSSCS